MLNLEKGSRINLEKDVGLTKMVVGLGWDTGDNFDLDVSVFLIDSEGKLPEDNFLVFYNNLKSPCGSVIHTGDNRTGEGDGDDEQLILDLDIVDPKVEKMVFVVTIFEAEKRKQNFGMVDNSFIRILNEDTNEELVRFNLSDNNKEDISIVVAEIYKQNGEWKFNAIGNSNNYTLNDYVNKYIKQ